MEILTHFIPTPRHSKLGWYEKFREQNFLLNYSPSNILLIGDSLISNKNRYQEVLSEYFSKHNTSNFVIRRGKIQNLLWKIKNLQFSSNSTLS